MGIGIPFRIGSGMRVICLLSRVLIALDRPPALQVTFDSPREILESKVVSGSGMEQGGSLDPNGMVGSARIFSDRNSHITVPLPRGLETGRLTLAFWARFDEKQGSAGVFYVDDGLLPVGINASGLLSAAGIYYSKSGDLRDGRWRHYVLTFDAKQGIKRFYLDGVLRAEDKWNQMIPIDRMVFGRHPTGREEWAFSGAIDDIRVYDYPILPRQAEVLGTRPVCENMVPQDGSAFVPTGTPLRLTFSHSMKWDGAVQYLKVSNLTLGLEVPGGWTERTSRMIEFHPANGFAVGSKYSVHLLDGLCNADPGNRLASPGFVGAFSVGSPFESDSKPSGGKSRLLAWYPLDESRSDQGLPCRIGGADGLFTGRWTWTNGVHGEPWFGRAIYFHGLSNEGLEIPAPPGLDDRAFSISFWLKATPVQPAVHREVLSVDEGRLVLRFGSSGRIMLSAKDLPSSIVGDPLLDDSWHPVVITASRHRRELILYYDGEQTKAPLQGYDASGPVQTIRLGGTGRGFVHGAFDDLRLYDQILSPDEVRAMVQPPRALRMVPPHESRGEPGVREVRLEFSDPMLLSSVSNGGVTILTRQPFREYQGEWTRDGVGRTLVFRAATPFPSGSVVHVQFGSGLQNFLHRPVRGPEFYYFYVP